MGKDLELVKRFCNVCMSDCDKMLKLKGMNDINQAFLMVEKQTLQRVINYIERLDKEGKF